MLRIDKSLPDAIDIASDLIRESKSPAYRRGVFDLLDWIAGLGYDATDDPGRAYLAARLGIDLNDETPSVAGTVGDPDATLAAFREHLAAGTIDIADYDTPTDLDRHESLAYAAEAADALDQHLSAGGRLPREWEPALPATIAQTRTDGDYEPTEHMLNALSESRDILRRVYRHQRVDPDEVNTALASIEGTGVFRL